MVNTKAMRWRGKAATSELVALQKCQLPTVHSLLNAEPSSSSLHCHSDLIYRAFDER